MLPPAQAGHLGPASAGLKDLFGELGDLKRIRSAGRDGTVATRLFRAAWTGLLAGAPAREVALSVTAAALAAARLGDINSAVLEAAGVSRPESTRILKSAVEEVSSGLSAPLRNELLAAAGRHLAGSEAAMPAFVAALEQQPRAGVTCPGKPRVMLQPPENHAEHCLMVAVYGVLLAPSYGADSATVFLAGLSHHLHNAGLPDSGFTGETLLGEHLGPVMGHFTGQALQQLPSSLRREVETARKILPDAETPEGRAFHAADVIDRVLEISQHLRAASLTMDQVLGDMGLVHDGPVKPFHDRVLSEMALP